MRSLVLSCIFVPFVLICGLVSCKKSPHSAKDVYQASEPVWHRGAESLASHPAELDLRDELDISAAAPVTSEIFGSCESAGIKTQFRRLLGDDKSVALFRIVPPALLLKDLKNEKTLCSYTIILSNAIGSIHRYENQLFVLTDNRPGDVTVGRDNEKPTTQFRRDQLTDQRVRYRGNGATGARLLCDEFAAFDLPFAQVMNMDLFDVDVTKLTQPDQHCRVLILRGREPLAISDAFQLLIPFEPLEITRQPLAVDDPGILQTQFMAINHGDVSPVTLQSFRIENIHMSPRRVRVPLTRGGVHVDIFYFYPATRLAVATEVSGNRLSLTVEGMTGEVSADRQTAIFTIPAHSIVTVNLQFTHEQMVSCFLPNNIFDVPMIRGDHRPQVAWTEDFSVALNPLTEFTVLDVNKDGTMIQSYPLPAKAMFASPGGHYSLDMMANQAKDSPLTNCTW